MFGGPPLQGSAVVQAEDPASLINAILYSPDMPEQLSYGGWDNMPAYANTLNDAQIAAVSNYVRGSWGNHGAAVTAGTVHAQR